MTSKNQAVEYNNNVLGVLAGVFIGGLAGAVTMLLLAPQSGEDTRTQIQEKGLELRDRTTDMVEEAMAQVRSDRTKLLKNGRQLVEQGQAMVAEQLDNVSEAAQAGKKAVQSANHNIPQPYPAS